MSLKQAQTALALILVLLALAAPAGASAYQLSFLIQLFMMIALAQSWNLISGMTGYVSFGHTAFFGVGAYAGALLLQFGFPWWLAILKGALIALVVATPLGFLTLRLRGPYFAIAMLGLNEIGRLIATLWVSLTQGGDGIPLSPEQLPTLNQNYYAMLFLAVAATGLIAWIRHRRFGLELRAIREDEEAAEMVGVDTTRNKVLAFVISAVFPGAVGAVYAFYTSYIDPASVFSPALNVQMIVMVLLGGSGTVWGPVLGAGVVKLVHEFTWAQFPALHLALLGVLLLVIVLFLPRGILSLAGRRRGVRPERAAEKGP